MDKAMVDEQGSARGVQVDVTCANENKVVGRIQVPTNVGDKGFLLSSRSVWSGFRPLLEDYRLPQKMQGDGQNLTCPRCQGLLCISGQTKAATEAVEEQRGGEGERLREAARRRALDTANQMKEGPVDVHMPTAGIDPGLMPITLGKTRIAAE